MDSITTPEQLKALDQIAEMETIGEVDINIFRERYLPILAGKVEGANPAVWLEVAKSPTAPVNVMENGKVAFKVPPLIREANIVPNTDSRNSMIEIVATTALKGEMHPRLGISYFREKSSEKIRMSDIDMEMLGQWNAILKRFGYETVGSHVADSVKAEAPKEETTPTISGYDEL